MGRAEMRGVLGQQGRSYDVEAFEEHCHTITDELFDYVTSGAQ